MERDRFEEAMELLEKRRRYAQYAVDYEERSICYDILDKQNRERLRHKVEAWDLAIDALREKQQREKSNGR